MERWFWSIMDNYKIQIYKLNIVSIIQAIIVLIIVWFALTGYYFAMCKKNNLPCQNDKPKEIPVDGLNKVKIFLKTANY